MKPYWIALSILACLSGIIYVCIDLAIRFKYQPFIDNKRGSKFVPPDYTSPKQLRDLLKANPVCLYGYIVCIEDYKENDLQATNNDQLCLLLTVYLKCMFTQCSIKLAKKRQDAIKNLKTDLRYFTSIECDFKFKSHNVSCLFAEQECKRTANIKKEVDSKTLCRNTEKYLKCFFKDCTMTESKQESYIEKFDNKLKRKKVRCNFNYRKLVRKGVDYNCSDLNNLYKCRNGECIHQDFVCNGEDDCLDGTDERHCDVNINSEL